METTRRQLTTIFILQNKFDLNFNTLITDYAGVPNKQSILLFIVMYKIYSPYRWLQLLYTRMDPVASAVQNHSSLNGAVEAAKKQKTLVFLARTQHLRVYRTVPNIRSTGTLFFWTSPTYVHVLVVAPLACSRFAAPPLST